MPKSTPRERARAHAGYKLRESNDAMFAIPAYKVHTLIEEAWLAGYRSRSNKRKVQPRMKLKALLKRSPPLD